MRCRYCLEPAGWWRRQCRVCGQLRQVFLTHRGVHMGTMLELFMATGARREQVEQFLDADPQGRGSVRDQIAADMTNELLGALGQRARQSPADVKRLRARGGWTNLDRRPRE